MAISDLDRAIQYYTGGAYRIDIHDSEWRNLASRLEEEGYTPEEFIHWFIHVIARDEPAKLTYKNMVVSGATWSRFLEDKARRKDEAGIVIQLQREKLEGAMKLFGPAALLNDNIEANPALRIEVAFYLQEMEGYDPLEVLHKYRPAAEHMLLGCPEYRMYLPYLNQKWGAA